MKKKLLTFIVALFPVLPALARPTIEFGPGGASPGGWSYDGAGTFSFSQDVVIQIVQGDTSDTLVGSFVQIPDLSVSGLLTGPYSLTALDPVLIKNSSGTVLLSGILGQGNLIPFDTTAVTYTKFQSDIAVTSVNNLIGSKVMGDTAAMDFNLTLQSSGDIEDMLSSAVSAGNGFSGSMTTTMTTPAPGTVLLASIGVGLVGWLRRRGKL